MPKKGRTSVKRLLAALLTALLLFSACPAISPAPAEAGASKAKKASSVRKAKSKKTSKVKAKKTSKAKSKKSSAKSRKSKKKSGGAGRGIGLYIVKPQLAARFGKVSAAARQKAVRETPMVDSKVVKDVATAKSDRHVQLFDLPLWIAPAKGYALEKVSRSCCADVKKKLSLEASELQVPFARLLAEFSPERLRSAGVSLKSRSRYVWNGSDAALLKVFQQKGKTVVGKWLLLIDRGEKSWMVSGLFDPRDASRSQAVLEMLKSVCWDEEQADARHAMLPSGFVKIEGTPFKLAGIRQDAFVYTKDGALPTKSPDGALFVVSRLPESRYTDDERLAFAKKNLEEVENGKPLEIVSQKELAAGGLPGVELAAYTALEPKKLVYEAMLFDAAETCVMVGLSRVDSLETIEQFHRLAASYSKSSPGR